MKLGLQRKRRQALIRSHCGNGDHGTQIFGNCVEEPKNYLNETSHLSLSDGMTKKNVSNGSCNLIKQPQSDAVVILKSKSEVGCMCSFGVNEEMLDKDDSHKSTSCMSEENRMGGVTIGVATPEFPAAPPVVPQDTHNNKEIGEVRPPHPSGSRFNSDGDMRQSDGKNISRLGCPRSLSSEAPHGSKDREEGVSRFSTSITDLSNAKCANDNYRVMEKRRRGGKDGEHLLKKELLKVPCGDQFKMKHSTEDPNCFSSTVSLPFVPIRLREHKDLDCKSESVEEGRRWLKGNSEGHSGNAEYESETISADMIKKYAPDFIFCPSYFYPPSSSRLCADQEGGLPLEAFIELRWPGLPNSKQEVKGGVSNNRNNGNSFSSTSRLTYSNSSSVLTNDLPPPLYFPHEFLGLNEGIKASEDSRTAVGDNGNGNSANYNREKYGCGKVRTGENCTLSALPLCGSSLCAFHPSGGWICRAVAYEESGIVPSSFLSHSEGEESTRIQRTAPTPFSNPSGASSPFSANKCDLPCSGTFSVPFEKIAKEKVKEEEVEEGGSSPAFPSSLSFPDFSPNIHPLSTSLSSLDGASAVVSVPPQPSPPPTPTTTTTTAPQEIGSHSSHGPPPSNGCATAAPMTSHPLSSFLSIHEDLVHSCPLLRELITGPNMCFSIPPVSALSRTSCVSSEKDAYTSISASYAPKIPHSNLRTPSFTTASGIFTGDEKEDTSNHSNKNSKNIFSHRLMWARVITCKEELDRRYGLSHAELSVQRQHVSRADQYRIMEALRHSILYSGMTIHVYEFTLQVDSLVYSLYPTSAAVHGNPQTENSREAQCFSTCMNLESCGSPKCSSSCELCSSHRASYVSVAYGLVTPSTVINFTSFSPVHYIVLELSQEMWSTSTVNGEMPLTWALRSFFPEFFKEKLAAVGATPLIRLVFTGRLRPWRCTEKVGTLKYQKKIRCTNPNHCESNDETLQFDMWNGTGARRNKKKTSSKIAKGVAVVGDADLASLQPSSTSYFHPNSRCFFPSVRASDSRSVDTSTCSLEACGTPEKGHVLNSSSATQQTDSFFVSPDNHARLAGEVLDIFHIEEISISGKCHYDHAAEQLTANVEMFLLRIKEGLDRERRNLAAERRQRSVKNVKEMEGNCKTTGESFTRKDHEINKAMKVGITVTRNDQNSKCSMRGKSSCNNDKTAYDGWEMEEKRKVRGEKTAEMNNGDYIPSSSPALHEDIDEHNETSGKINECTSNAVGRMSSISRDLNASPTPYPLCSAPVSPLKSLVSRPAQKSDPSSGFRGKDETGKKVENHLYVGRRSGNAGTRSRRDSLGVGVPSEGLHKNTSRSALKTSLFCVAPATFQPNCCDFTCSRQSNTLEALSLVLQWGSTEINGHTTPDVHFHHTGMAITVVTAGKGVYDATNAIGQLVCSGLHDLGVEKVHMVCLSRPPLHVTPLLVYSTNDITLMTQSHLNTDPHYYYLKDDSDKLQQVDDFDTPVPLSATKTNTMNEQGVHPVRSQTSRSSSPHFSFASTPLHRNVESLYYESPPWMQVFFYYPLQTENNHEIQFGLFTKEEWNTWYCRYPSKCLYLPRLMYYRDLSSSSFFSTPTRLTDERGADEDLSARNVSLSGVRRKSRLPCACAYKKNRKEPTTFEDAGLNYFSQCSSALFSTQLTEITTGRIRKALHRSPRAKPSELQVLQPGLGIPATLLPSIRSIVFPFNSFIPPKWWCWWGLNSRFSLPRKYSSSLSRTITRKDGLFSPLKNVFDFSPHGSHGSRHDYCTCGNVFYDSSRAPLEKKQKLFQYSGSDENLVYENPFRPKHDLHRHSLVEMSYPFLWHPLCCPAMLGNKSPKMFVSYLSYASTPSLSNGRLLSEQNRLNCMDNNGCGVGERTVDGMMVHKEKEGWWKGDGVGSLFQSLSLQWWETVANPALQKKEDNTDERRNKIGLEGSVFCEQYDVLNNHEAEGVRLREVDEWKKTPMQLLYEDDLAEATQKLCSFHVFSRLHLPPEWWLACHHNHRDPKSTGKRTRKSVRKTPWKTKAYRENGSSFDVQNDKLLKKSSPFFNFATNRPGEAPVLADVAVHSCLSLGRGVLNKVNCEEENIRENCQTIDDIHSKMRSQLPFSSPPCFTFPGDSSFDSHLCRGKCNASFSHLRTCSPLVDVQAEWFTTKDVPRRPSRDELNSEIDSCNSSSISSSTSCSGDQCRKSCPQFTPFSSSLYHSISCSSPSPQTSRSSTPSASFCRGNISKKEEKKAVIVSYGTRVVDTELRSGLLCLRLSLLSCSCSCGREDDDLELQKRHRDPPNNTMKEGKWFHKKDVDETVEGECPIPEVQTYLPVPKMQEMIRSAEISEMQKCKYSISPFSSSSAIPRHFIPHCASPHYFSPCQSNTCQSRQKKSNRIWKPSLISNPEEWKTFMKCFRGRDGQLAAIYQRWVLEHQKNALALYTLRPEKGQDEEVGETIECPRHLETHYTCSKTSSSMKLEKGEALADSCCSCYMSEGATDGPFFSSGTVFKRNEQVERESKTQERSGTPVNPRVPSASERSSSQPSATTIGPDSHSHLFPSVSSTFLPDIRRKENAGKRVTPIKLVPSAGSTSPTSVFPSAFNAESIFSREDSWCSADGTVLWLATQGNDIEFTSCEEVVLEFLPERFTTFSCSSPKVAKADILGHSSNSISAFSRSHPLSSVPAVFFGSSSLSSLPSQQPLMMEVDVKTPHEIQGFQASPKGNDQRSSNAVDFPYCASASVTGPEEASTKDNKLVVVVANISLGHVLLFGLSLIDPITGKEDRRGYRNTALLPHGQDVVSTAQIFQRRWHYAHPLFPWRGFHEVEKGESTGVSQLYARSITTRNVQGVQPYGKIRFYKADEQLINTFLGCKPHCSCSSLNETPMAPSTFEGDREKGKSFFFSQETIPSSNSLISSSCFSSFSLPTANIWYRPRCFSGTSVINMFSSSWECLCRTRLLPLYGVRSRLAKSSFMPISTHQYPLRSAPYASNEENSNNRDEGQHLPHHILQEYVNQRRDFSSALSPLSSLNEFHKKQSGTTGAIPGKKGIAYSSNTSRIGFGKSLGVQLPDKEEEAYSHFMEFVWQRLEYNYQIVWENSTPGNSSIISYHTSNRERSVLFPRVGASVSTVNCAGSRRYLMSPLQLKAPPYGFPILLTICHQQHKLSFVKGRGANSAIGSPCCSSGCSSNNSNNAASTTFSQHCSTHNLSNTSSSSSTVLHGCHSNEFQLTGEGKSGEKEISSVSIVRELHRGRYTAHPWETSSVLTYQYALWNFLCADNLSHSSAYNPPFQILDEEEVPSSDKKEEWKNETKLMVKSCSEQRIDGGRKTTNCEKRGTTGKCRQGKRSYIPSEASTLCFEFLPKTLVMQPVLTVKSTIFWETLDEWISQQPFSRQTTICTPGGQGVSSYSVLPLCSQKVSSLSSASHSGPSLCHSANSSSNRKITANVKGGLTTTTSMLSNASRSAPPPLVSSSLGLSSSSPQRCFPSPLPDELLPRVFQLGVILLPLMHKTGSLTGCHRRNDEDMRGDEKGKVQKREMESNIHQVGESVDKANMLKKPIGQKQENQGLRCPVRSCKSEKITFSGHKEGDTDPLGPSHFLTRSSTDNLVLIKNITTSFCSPPCFDSSLAINSRPFISNRLRRMLYRIQVLLEENLMRTIPRSVPDTSTRRARNKNYKSLAFSPSAATNPLSCDYFHDDCVPPNTSGEEDYARVQCCASRSFPDCFSSPSLFPLGVYVLSAGGSASVLPSSCTRVFDEMSSYTGSKKKIFHGHTGADSVSLPDESLSQNSAGVNPHNVDRALQVTHSPQKSMLHQSFHGGRGITQQLPATINLQILYRVPSVNDDGGENTKMAERGERMESERGNGGRETNFFTFSCTRFTSLDIRFSSHLCALSLQSQSEKGAMSSLPVSRSTHLLNDHKLYCVPLTLTWGTISAPMVCRVWQLLLEAASDADTQFLLVPFPSLWYYRYPPNSSNAPNALRHTSEKRVASLSSTASGWSSGSLFTSTAENNCVGARKSPGIKQNEQIEAINNQKKVGKRGGKIVHEQIGVKEEQKEMNSIPGAVNYETFAPDTIPNELQTQVENLGIRGAESENLSDDISENCASLGMQNDVRLHTASSPSSSPFESSLEPSHHHEWLSHFVTCGYPFTVPSLTSLDDAVEFQQCWIERITSIEARRQQQCNTSSTQALHFSCAFPCALSCPFGDIPGEEPSPLLPISASLDNHHSDPHSRRGLQVRFQEHSIGKERDRRTSPSRPCGHSSSRSPSVEKKKTFFSFREPQRASTTICNNFFPSCTSSISPAGGCPSSVSRSSLGMKTGRQAKNAANVNSTDPLPLDFSYAYRCHNHYPRPQSMSCAGDSWTSSGSSSAYSDSLPPLFYLPTAPSSWVKETSNSSQYVDAADNAEKKIREMSFRQDRPLELNEMHFEGCNRMSARTENISIQEEMRGSEVPLGGRKQVKALLSSTIHGGCGQSTDSLGLKEEETKEGGCFVHCSGASYIIFYSRTRLRFLIAKQQRMLKARLALLNLQQRVLTTKNVKRKVKSYSQTNNEVQDSRVCHYTTSPECLSLHHEQAVYPEAEVGVKEEEDTESSSTESENYDPSQSLLALIPSYIPPLPPLVVGEWRQNVSYAHGTIQQWKLLCAIKEESTCVYREWNARKKKNS